MRRWLAVLGLSCASLAALAALLRPAPAPPAPQLEGVRIAHRAGRVPGPDNSLAALSHSADAGADAIEIDVRRGPGGRPVCAHDAEQVPGAVALTEMLDAALERGLLVEIDVKTGVFGDRALLAAIAQIIAERSAYDRVWVSAFQPIAAWQLRRIDPAVALGWPMPETGSSLLDAIVAHPGLARWMGACVLEPEAGLVTEARLRRWSRSFDAIEVWVVDDPVHVAALRLAGAAVVVDDLAPSGDR